MIVSQLFATLRKTSSLSHPLAWISAPTLWSPCSLFFLHFSKYSSTQLRFCNLLAIPQLQLQTLLLLYQLDYSFQFFSPKDDFLHKKCLLSTHFYLVFDLFFHAPMTQSSQNSAISLYSWTPSSPRVKKWPGAEDKKRPCQSSFAFQSEIWVFSVGNISFA